MRAWDQDGRPGAVLFLWGRVWSFFVSLDCSREPPLVQLSAYGQDEPIPFHRSLWSGNATEPRVWHVMVSRMLELEGFALARVEDFEWFNQLVVPELEAEAEEARQRWLAQREKSEDVRKKWREALENGDEEEGPSKPVV